MRVGAVTVTYNSRQVLHPFLASMLRQTYSGWNLYVIDNASQDQTGELLSSFADPRIHLILNSSNVGFAQANNQGIQQALKDGCDAVLLLNNDTEFDATFLEALLKGLIDHGCDMVAPKILFHHDRTIWSAGGGFDRRRACAGVHYGYREKDYGQYDLPRRIDHAPACCLLVRKQVFDAVGLLDTHYFTYVEDTDFCYRASRAGLALMYLPSVTMLHKAHSLTGGSLSAFMMRYVTRNRVYFILKHFGLLRGLFYLPLYQMHLLLELLSQKVGMSMFWLREKAFWEGVSLWRHSVAGH